MKSLPPFRTARCTIRVGASCAVAFCVAGVFVAQAHACSVPVYRYALEHWRPDPYVLFVFHQGGLSADQNAIVESLRPEAIEGVPTANVFVKTVDVESELNSDEVLKQIWTENRSDTLPWMVLHSPPKLGPPQTVWSGRLTAAHAKLVMDSPARTTIKDRLINGDSAVWVFLDGKDAKRNDASFQMLTRELERLQSSLKLSEIADEDLPDLAISPESLKVAFSALRVSRDDPAERAFVDMLLRVEPDLLDVETVDQPMVFPVFGRGRALYAIVGDGISPNVIEEAAQFLTGPCQCTVKRQNPGIDMLMNVDWDELIQPTDIEETELPPLAGFSSFGQLDMDDEEVAVEEQEDVADAAETKSAAPPKEEVPANTDAAQVQVVDGSDDGDRQSQSVMAIGLLLLVGGVLGTVLLKSSGT